MAPNTPVQEGELKPISEGTYTLTEGETTVTITISESNGPDSRSVYFGDYNVSAFLNSTPDGSGMEGIQKYARFYLQLQKIRTQWIGSSMELRSFFNQLSGTTLGVVSLGTLGLSAYENSVPLALLGLISGWLAADDIKKGKFQEFVSFFQRTYPEFFVKTKQNSMSYIGSQESILPPSVQNIILSIIQTKTRMEQILRDEGGYVSKLGQKLKTAFSSPK